MELEQLLTECKKGSLPAQKCVFDRFATSMFLVCRRYLKSDELAEEVLMNGFLKFFQGLTAFRYLNEAATAGWLKKIMVRECLMELRSAPMLHIAVESLPEPGIDPCILHDLSAAEIFRLITALPQGYRTVFNLYEVEGYSHREIAEALGISEGTSKSQLSKARQLLQQLLIQKDGDHAFRKTK
ncbi:MAG TPA: sigma-70 family RNA polymerase sigma factor [Chitinophagaceae bacterium]|nr:sigma-70 family RNA polymerase sigma factor [Chitinophagaceae bacterium]